VDGMAAKNRGSVYRPGYTPGIRRFELFSITIFALACAWTSYRLFPYSERDAWLMVGAAALAYLGSDLTSGFVHWIFDTWGTPTTPLLGRPFIRPFREHHVDQLEITRHDFVETNGNNCFIGTLPLLFALAIPMGSRLSVGVVTFLLWLVVFTMLTNQFHKWAHMETPPWFVGWLQRIHLVLPPSHHAVHHSHPYLSRYAITVGWTNWLTDGLGFFRLLESVMARLSGAVPRRDDLGDALAQQVVEESAASSECPGEALRG